MADVNHSATLAVVGALAIGLAACSGSPESGPLDIGGACSEYRASVSTLPSASNIRPNDRAQLAHIAADLKASAPKLRALAAKVDVSDLSAFFRAAATTYEEFQRATSDLLAGKDPSEKWASDLSTYDASLQAGVDNCSDHG